MAPPSRKDIEEAGQLAPGVSCEIARRDINTFCELVLRDEETNRPIGKQISLHRTWHELCDKHKRLIIWAPISHGKSSTITVARLLFTLGRNPEMRGAIISNTKGLAAKSLRSIGRYIEESEPLHQVFPTLRRSPRKVDPWGGLALTIDRPTAARDPSLQALGIHGNVEGSRLNFVIYDDPLDPENTSSEAMLQDTYDWHHDVIEGRMEEDAWIIVLVTAWHPRDMAHRLFRQPGWYGERFPAVNPKTGRPIWPQRWSLERLAEKRVLLGPLNAARKLDLVPRADEEATFKVADIQRAQDRGTDVTLLPEILPADRPDGAWIVTGVDLAASKSKRANRTAICTIMLHPNGDKQLVWIESGKWSGAEIERRLVATYERYSSLIWVEDNGVQAALIDMFEQHTALPVRPVSTTSQRKHSPEFGIAHLATEFFNGRWIIPRHCGSQAAEVDALLGELIFYKPKEHSGDRAMSLWIANTGARMSGMRALPEVRVSVIGGGAAGEARKGEKDKANETKENELEPRRGSSRGPRLVWSVFR